jgi:hypothetical protein
MGTYDAQQVCLNGHQISASYHRSPEFRSDYCKICGEKTTYQCPDCHADIKGRFDFEGLVGGFTTPVPKFCEKCGKSFPWADKISGDDDEVTKLAPDVSVERICSRIALVIHELRDRHDHRPTLDVGDEFDLQDLLHSLLHLFFDDVRAEEYTPSYAGKSTRMDFLLKNESIVIEAKMTRKGLGAKEVGEQLIVDIAHYQSHPSCKTLFCLIYDPDHRVKNPRGMESDLSGKRDRLEVKVFVVPKGT